MCSLSDNWVYQYAWQQYLARLQTSQSVLFSFYLISECLGLITSLVKATFVSQLISSKCEHLIFCYIKIHLHTNYCFLFILVSNNCTKFPPLPVGGKDVIWWIAVWLQKKITPWHPYVNCYVIGLPQSLIKEDVRLS